MTSIAELAHLETRSDESDESSPGAVESDAGDFEENHEAVEHAGSDVAHIVVEPDGTALPGHVTGVLEAEASGTAT